MGLRPSWVDGSDDPEGPFPLDNLPCGVFSTNGAPDRRCGVAIGSFVLDLAGLAQAGLLQIDAPLAPVWNAVMALGPDAWANLRARLTALLDEGSADRDAVEPHLVPLSEATLHMPIEVAEFTDFYAGRHHATNVGTMFRGPENALPANWLSIPIGYNGRASTVVVSGTDILRPNGQTKSPEEDLPVWGASARLDFELELGAVIGTGNPMGQPVTVAQADAMIFGYVLLNDWSARDVQAWEYQPLGPFQAKAFATTIGPWIVMRAALEPFRRSAPARDRPLLPYLREPGPMLYDIELSVDLAPADAPATTVTRTNAGMLYYSAAQQIAHHASSGCAMRTGDLIGSGTISGPEPSSRGSLLELSWGGRNPITLSDGAGRGFLEDGDTVTLRGHAQGDGFRIGFGTCNGTIRPAPDFPPEVKE